MSTCHVFTYGTLMLAEVMHVVSGSAFDSRQARLRHYQRFQIRDKVYPAIIPVADSWTDGIVYLDVDSTSLQRLDYFEDVIYSRHEVTVELEDTETLTACAYVINPEYETMLSEKPWSVAEFRDRCLDSYVRRSARWMRDYRDPNSPHAGS